MLAPWYRSAGAPVSTEEEPEPAAIGRAARRGA
jgi:hypothetical protein